jgi:hypothetical protein
LSERDYRVIVVRASEVEVNVDAVLDALAAEIARS